jgi:hypothetical protein
VYKCRDCLTGCQLRCSECMVSAHLDHPLHCIEVCYSIFVVLDATDDWVFRSGMDLFLRKLRSKNLASVFS